MQAELESQQKLLLWLLAVQNDGSMFLKDIKLSFKPAAKRKELHRFGLTEESNAKNPATGRSTTKIQLTDKGWEWCQDHLHEKIETKSTSTPAILSGLLNALGRFFINQDDCNSLGELFALARPKAIDSSTERPPESEAGTASTAAAIISPDSATQAASANPTQVSNALLQACKELSQDQPNVRIRLKDLRPLLSQYSRAEVDAVLTDLQQQGRLRLWRLDDSSEITDLDREAAVKSEIGTEQHIIYLEGVLS